VHSGQQWDAPNGWAPLQWVAAQGLQNYGQQKMAMEVSWRFLSNVQHTYDSQQKLVEKYDVSSTGTGGGGGEYPLQDGFGWTNGVTLKMLDLVCPQEKPCDSLPASRPLDKVEKPVATVSTQPAANDAVAGADKKRRRNSRRAHRRVYFSLQAPIALVCCFQVARVDGRLLC
jgi:alpha,alpha-trehalase